jgi:hypothetical protein
MKYRTIPSFREALKNPLPKPFEVSAPYRQQIQEMEQQNKTSRILLMVFFALATAAVIILSASEAKAWQRVSQEKP